VRERCGTHEPARSDTARLVHDTPGVATDVVAAWQRSLGNAAVSRILARDAKPSGGQLDPVIETVRGPILGEYGLYRWLVRYRLASPAPVNGWLIQELFMESTAREALGIGPDHFWECWRIRSGEQYHGDPDDEGGVLYDDRYVRGAGSDPGADPKGWHRHTGVIRFYPGPLPPEFGEDSGIHYYQTRSKPSGWTGQGARHDAYSEWDYSGGQKRLNGFVAYAGTTEVRKGDRVQFRARAATPALQPVPRHTTAEPDPTAPEEPEAAELTA
jgi:hypothetical protein